MLWRRATLNGTLRSCYEGQGVETRIPIGLTFPAINGGNRRGKMPTRRNEKTARWKVLIVDEQPLVRRGLAELILRDPSLMVAAEAGTRADALRALAARPCDLVTLELALEGEDGLELLKDIHTRFPDVRTLVISNHDEKIYAERAFRAGARGYVTKREPEKAVLAAITRVLAGEKHISDRMTAFFAEQYLERSAKKAAGSAIGMLTDRELTVFRLLGEHKTRRDIGRSLKLSVKTVESYRAKIKEKLGLKSGTELAERATRWVADGK